jgi:hypothetical protein
MKTEEINKEYRTVHFINSVRYGTVTYPFYIRRYKKASYIVCEHEERTLTFCLSPKSILNFMVSVIMAAR